MREPGEITAIFAVTPVAVSEENNHEPAVAPGIALLKLVKLPVNSTGYTIERYVLAAILPGTDATAGAVIAHPFESKARALESCAANTDHPVPKATDPLVAVWTFIIYIVKDPPPPPPDAFIVTAPRPLEGLIVTFVPAIIDVTAPGAPVAPVVP